MLLSLAAANGPAHAGCTSNDVSSLQLPCPKPATKNKNREKPKKKTRGLSRIEPNSQPPSLSCENIEQAGIIGRLLAPVEGEDGCGIDNPVSMTAVRAGSTIRLSAPAKINCGLARQFAAFLRDNVAANARNILGSELTGVRVAASYVCRTRNRKPGAKLSEHAMGNAIDISAFHFANGLVIAVEDGWRAKDMQSAFLKATHATACQHFTTVIGPDGDQWHQDHFHLDLGKHDKTGRYRICQ